jgi:hypothetical protein
MMTGEPNQEPEYREEEPAFDLRHGLKVLLIVGAIVLVISMVCLGIWPAAH